MRDLAAAARAGDSTAEYLMANALRYCDEHLRPFHPPDGSIRTLSDVETHWAKMPTRYRQDLYQAYERCRDFLEDPADQEATSSWSRWLDQADAARYPPAMSEAADDVRVADLLMDSANAAGGDVAPPTAGPARDHALAAILSGDPDCIFRMANWVDGTTRSQEDYVDLTSAWMLLACQRGYDDCGPQSEWIKSVCDVGQSCLEVHSALDYLQKQLGSRFDGVQRLAEQIGNAVDSKNPDAVASYL